MKNKTIEKIQKVVKEIDNMGKPDTVEEQLITVMGEDEFSLGSYIKRVLGEYNDMVEDKDDRVDTEDFSIIGVTIKDATIVDKHGDVTFVDFENKQKLDILFQLQTGLVTITAIPIDSEKFSLKFTSAFGNHPMLDEVELLKFNKYKIKKKKLVAFTSDGRFKLTFKYNGKLKLDRIGDEK